MRLFGVCLISGTHSYTVTNVRSASNKVKETTYHASYKEESTLLPNKSTMSLTLGLMGVLTRLVDSKPKFFTRFLAYLDWDMNIHDSC